MERVAVYPGTFDPVTLGHVDIVTRGSKLFTRLLVAVADNTAKTPLFPLADRMRLLRESVGHLEGVEVCRLDGLLVEFARQQKATAVLRGLRAVSDFEYEFQLASMNRQLAPEVEMVYLMSGESTMFISSRLVKEVAAMGGDVAPFVPARVAQELRDRLRAVGSLPAG